RFEGALMLPGEPQQRGGCTAQGLEPPDAEQLRGGVVPLGDVTASVQGDGGHPRHPQQFVDDHVGPPPGAKALDAPRRLLVKGTLPAVRRSRCRSAENVMAASRVRRTPFASRALSREDTGEL